MTSLRDFFLFIFLSSLCLLYYIEEEEASYSYYSSPWRHFGRLFTTVHSFSLSLFLSFSLSLFLSFSLSLRLSVGKQSFKTYRIIPQRCHHFCDVSYYYYPSIARLFHVAFLYRSGALTLWGRGVSKHREIFSPVHNSEHLSSIIAMGVSWNQLSVYS